MPLQKMMIESFIFILQCRSKQAVLHQEKTSSIPLVYYDESNVFRLVCYYYFISFSKLKAKFKCEMLDLQCFVVANTTS